MVAALAACGGADGGGLDWDRCYIEVPGETTVERACGTCPGEVIAASCIDRGTVKACVEDPESWCDTVDGESR